MTGGQRVLLTVGAALAVLAASVLLLGGPPRAVEADPGRLRVTLGGSGCDVVTCGPTC